MRQERKNPDKALDFGIETESRLRLIVNRTPALIYSTRPDGYIDFLNQQCLDLSAALSRRCPDGVGPRQFIPMTLKEFGHVARGSGDRRTLAR